MKEITRSILTVYFADGCQLPKSKLTTKWGTGDSVEWDDAVRLWEHPNEAGSGVLADGTVYASYHVEHSSHLIRIFTSLNRTGVLFSDDELAVIDDTYDSLVES